MVTDIVKDEVIYTDYDCWDTLEAGMTKAERDEFTEKCIEKYNKSNNRFLFYPWGIYCTAISRRNLWQAIVSFKEDYCYADTDSIFCINLKDHMDFINRYNANCGKKLRRMCEHYGIDYNELLPKTIKGETKPLGVWDIEHENIDVFKSLGAKRYLMNVDGNISMTVAGVNKKAAVPYLLDRYGKEDIFLAFSNHLEIPADHTGKLTHVYLDFNQSARITDYLGGVYYADNEPPSVYLEKAAYYFDITQDYLDFIKGVQYTK